MDEEEIDGMVLPLFVAVTVNVKLSPASTVLLVGLRDKVGVAVDEEENDRYSRLHQPVFPDEVLTFTHPLLLVLSTTVSFVPLGSTCKTE